MNESLLLVAFLAFAAGFIVKTLLTGLKAFSLSANFVQNTGFQSLMLLGTAVYKISYIDQLCAMTLEKMGKPEDAKKMRLELQEQFEDWKVEVVEDYIQSYPVAYKWQLEFNDWKGLMGELTDIYKERKV